MNEKKLKILEATFKLIARHGYDKTTVNMICEEVGIKKPSLYYFFESKEKVFLELINHYFDYEKYETELTTDRTGNPKTDLLHFGEQLFEYYKSSEDMLRVGLEFYIQASRIKAFDDFLQDLTYKSKSFLYEYLDSSNAKDKLINTDDLTTVTELLVSILFNAEITFVMNDEIDYKGLWIFTVNTYFKD